jgi:hypothetical protein
MESIVRLNKFKHQLIKFKKNKNSRIVKLKCINEV